MSEYYKVAIREGKDKHYFSKPQKVWKSSDISWLCDLKKNKMHQLAAQLYHAQGWIRQDI